MGVMVSYPLVVAMDGEYVINDINNPTHWYRVAAEERIVWGDRVFQWRQKFRTYLRWAVSIPAGSTVTSAMLTVKTNDPDSTEGVTSFTPTINLIDQDNCLAPAAQMPFTTEPWIDVATLPTYSGSPVSWPITIPWVESTDYNSVDISTLAQAYIDRPGYLPGQYLGLMIEEGNAAEGDTRLAYVTAGVTPVLTIRYKRWGDRWYKWASARP